MVDGLSIEKMINDLRLITEDESQAGTTRIGFTKTYRRGVDYIKAAMKKAGLTVWEDSVGNVYGRLEGSEANLPAIVTGSHLDTVRCAGAYDGIAGVVCGIAAAEQLRNRDKPLRHPLEVIALIEEEGTRFGQVVLGSKFITGEFGDGDLERIVDPESGQSLKSILADYLPSETKPAYREQNEIAVFIELHDEQGPLLEEKQVDIGLVRGIVAISWLTIRVEGFAGHAGTVPMPLRRDAMTGAARLIDNIAKHTTEAYPYEATATVGKIKLLPGSSNSVPDECSFTVDLRSGRLSVIEDLTVEIQEQANAIAAALSLKITVTVDSKVPGIEMDKRVQECLAASCEKLGYSSLAMDSGAGHDAMIFAKRWPTGMLFIPCAKGITHNPAEYVKPEHLAKGANILYESVISLDQRLN